MRAGRALFAAVAVVAAATGGHMPARGSEPGHAITFVGVRYDQADLAKLGIGTEGYWFPQFDAAAPVEARGTGENAVDALPAWTAPLNHATVTSPVGCEPVTIAAGCLPTYAFRAFSQDGPATSKGGQPSWSWVTLPDGTTGLSGAIVDPHTTNGVNNTVNRIQLVDGVPGTFYLHVLVDNTGGAHDSSRVQARGNIGTLDDDNQVDPLSYPGVGGTCLAFNGVPDIYTFRFEGFAAGDYMKLRLQGGPDRVASFGGLLFDDESFEPHGRHRNAPGAEWRSPDEC